MCYISCPIKVKLEKLHVFSETFCVRPQSDSICFMTLWHFSCPTRIWLGMFHFAQTQVNLTNRWRGLYPCFCQIALQLQLVCWHKTYPTRDILEIFTVQHIQSNLGQTQNDSQAWLCYNYCLIKVGLSQKWRHKKPVRHFSDMNCDTQLGYHKKPNRNFSDLKIVTNVGWHKTYPKFVGYGFWHTTGCHKKPIWNFSDLNSVTNGPGMGPKLKNGLI